MILSSGPPRFRGSWWAEAAGVALVRSIAAILGMSSHLFGREGRPKKGRLPGGTGRASPRAVRGPRLIMTAAAARPTRTARTREVISRVPITVTRGCDILSRLLAGGLHISNMCGIRVLPSIMA